MRIFTAIKFSDQTTKEMYDHACNIKHAFPAVAVPHIQNIHATFHFFASISDGECSRLIAIYEDVLKSMQPFRITIGEIGIFPVRGFPRILWRGINEGSVLCRDIKMSIDRELERIPLGVEKRGFHPHITIGRIKKTVDRKALEGYIATHQYAAHSEICATFHVIKSTLTKTGPVYETIKEIPLSVS